MVSDAATRWCAAAAGVTELGMALAALVVTVASVIAATRTRPHRRVAILSFIHFSLLLSCQSAC